MRLVAVADTHMFHDSLKVPEGDVLIHAGDLCGRGTMEELSDALDWIRCLPHRTKIVVAGNHDFPFERTPKRAQALLGPELIYLQDSGTVVDGIRFWGSPWQPEFFGWAFNLPRGPELAAKWAQIPADTQVLITHGPPYGAGDRVTPVDRVGCRDLRARIEVARPRLHLFGHIHEDGGAWLVGSTLCANVTTADGGRGPTVIDFEGDRAKLVAAP